MFLLRIIIHKNKSFKTYFIYPAFLFLYKSKLKVSIVNIIREATDAGAEESEMELLREQQILGKQVLAIAVLVILITAPIGAIAVMTAGTQYIFIISYY